MAVQGSLRVVADFTHTAAESIAANTSAKQINALLSWVDGSGAGATNKIWSPLTQYSVSASTNTDLDLSGTLAGTYGTVSFAAIKGLVIKAGASNPGNLTVGNVTNGIVAFFGAATHTIAIQPGGIFAIATGGASGYTITNSTADLLRIASSGTTGTHTWDILVWGI